MESIIVIVGFLGAGKTTLLRYLAERFLEEDWKPYVILNDYENAYLDAQQLAERLLPKSVRALNGSCICCSGVNELREFVNRIPERENGVTLVEANGTTDACSLMGFMGVGLDDRFMPPIQISVLDVKNWQKRGENNELEANQIQVSSLVVLTHLEDVSEERVAQVEDDVRKLNPLASIVTTSELRVLLLPKLRPSKNKASPIDHEKTHWASCSVDLPDLPNLRSIQDVCDSIPPSVLRVKGCTKIGQDKAYTYFERCPDGEVYVRSYRGTPSTGPKLLAVGPGSDPVLLQSAVAKSLQLKQF